MKKDWLFEIEDYSKKKVHLSLERWKHINEDHPEIAQYLEEIQETLKNPLGVSSLSDDEKINYYYKYFKNRPSPAKYLLVIVKYLNGEGFIVTAYFVRTIR